MRRYVSLNWQGLKNVQDRMLGLMRIGILIEPQDDKSMTLSRHSRLNAPP
jgi:hypothetical protein